MPNKQKSGPRKGARKVEEGSGTQLNATQFNVGWLKSPSRQGLGGWVKLPVEDCSTNRHHQGGGPNGRGRGPNGAFS